MTFNLRKLCTILSKLALAWSIVGFIGPGMPAQAQVKKYLVFFTDKNNSPYRNAQPSTFLTQKSLDRRQRQGISLKEHDLPVNPAYVQQVAQAGATIWYTSRWLNAAVIECDATTLQAVQGLSCIRPNLDRLLNLRKPGNLLNTGALESNLAVTSESIAGQLSEITKVKRSYQLSRIANLNYGQSGVQNQLLEIDSMHNAGFDGAGMTIAIMDAGFLNVDQHEAFRHMRTGGNIKGTFDFVTGTVGNVYRGNSHGGAVLSIMAGYLDGKLIGPAHAADFYLFRTEDAPTEYEIECANWVIAAERADSLGCDLINTSLGYSDFDDPNMNYSLADLDGMRTFMSRAATIAASTGMLLFNSAGNSGTSVVWRGKITVPADADSIVTVGATDVFGTRAFFSSMGPSADGRIKPEVAGPGAQIVVYNPNVPEGIASSNGTSFSSPIVCGLAAGIWQAFPNLTAMELREVLKNSASQAQSPDTLVGWGIPKFSQVRRLITSQPGNLVAKSGIKLLLNPVSGGQAIQILAPELGWQGSISITDATGKALHSSQLVLQQNSTADLDWQAPVSGIYMIRAIGKTGMQSQSFRLVVQ